MTRGIDRRALRDAPFLLEHTASRAARTVTPFGFAGLLHWFLTGFWAETPETLHVAGVWFGPPGQNIAPELVGGSVLGAPKQAGAMRQLLENSASQVYDHDTPDARYARPMRAALARLAMRDSDAPFMARYLVQVAYAQGDWQSVAWRWFPIHPFVHRAFTLQSLERLLVQYRDEPPARPLPTWVDLSPSQQAAIQAGEAEA